MAYTEAQIAEHCAITGQKPADVQAKLKKTAEKRKAISDAYALTKKAKKK